MAGDVLGGQIDDVLELWYGFVDDHNFLLDYFTQSSVCEGGCRQRSACPRFDTCPKTGADVKHADTERWERLFWPAMKDHGVFLTPNQFEPQFVSYAHTDEDIERTLEAYNMPSKITGVTPIGERILAVLENDARATQTEIAERADVSRPTVKKHIQELEEDGVVVGYSVDVNPKKLSEQRIAIIGIDIESARFSDVLAGCREFDAIKTLYIASGDHTLIAELRVANTDDLDTLLSDQLLGIEGVVDVHPTLLHERLK